LSSLRFASQVSQCELGKPKRKLRDMSDSKEENTANKKANTSSTPMITDTPKQQQPTRVIQKASSFAIAHPTPSIPVEAKLGSSLDAVLGFSSTATSEDSMEVVTTTSSSNPSSRVNTPNKVRFGAAASGLKPPSGASTASAKTTKTSGISCLAKAKTQTPTKAKK
jgi:CCR4-NOT transcriptional regulation complex NOT5 subunit